MAKWKKQSHVVYQCCYHIVWCPKYRRRVLGGRVARRLDELIEQIAVEHGRDGIMCNAVAPGKIMTGAPGDLAADPSSLAYVRSRTPFSRLGEPEDVAAAVSFLASCRASYISGINLMVDGGWMAY